MSKEAPVFARGPIAIARPTVARIDLHALHHNLERVRALAPGRRLQAVVKANAYGHGLATVGRALADRVDGLAVASIDEALRLRDAGVNTPVLLLEGVFEAAELALCERYGLAQVVHSEYQLGWLRDYRPTAQPLTAWLKVDTGMHRLGFAAARARQAYATLHALPAVAEPGLLTHLANADQRDHPTTSAQLALFEQLCRGLPGPRSVANSAAVLGLAQPGDWLRPGLMLYGASPFADTVGSEFGLRPVMTLETRLIARHRLAAGQAIGYGGTWRCPEPMPVGVAAVGYGDGYPRALPSGSPVLVNGRPSRLLGRVSMDMISVDLRATDARVGDRVVLWGEGLAVERLAAAAGTIPYTLLSGLGARVKTAVVDEKK